MCYYEATKGEINHTEHWKKTCMEGTCYIATTTKNILHISTERKVCIIGVEIRPSVVKS